MRKLDAEGFINYTTEQIAEAKKSGDSARIEAITATVASVAKAHDAGEAVIVVKGFEGSEEIEISVAARSNDGTPAIGQPIDEASANGQGIAPNIGDLAKGDDKGDKGDKGEPTDKGDADKGDADKGDDKANAGDDDDWPDDLNSPNPEKTWGTDPQ